MDPALRHRWERVAGAGAIVAAIVHGLVTPEHFEEWWGYGYFFLGATVAQVLLGLALILDAFERPKDRRFVVLAGLVGTLALIAVYVVTRTVGIPFAGPAQGEVEGVDAPGLVAVAAESLTALALVRLARA